MVICSVTIHGLSIPFFSLGRRVHSVGSRTWSRHASAIPEWATQTKYITRGQDVVINRDPINTMEKGEGAVSVVESKRNPPPSGEDGPEVIEESRLSPTATLAELESMKEDVADGTEDAVEWREGPHKVIETRGGPGQDVSRPLLSLSFIYLTFVHRSKLRLFAMRLTPNRKTPLPFSRDETVPPCRWLEHTSAAFATVGNTSEGT